MEEGPPLCVCGSNQRVSMVIESVPCCRVCGTIYAIMENEGLKVLPIEAINDPYRFINKRMPKPETKKLHPKGKKK